MKLNDLSIVIVTFRSEEKIINCLNSIPENIKVIIVENSNNKSFKEKLENQFKNVECILTGDNKGYSIANNIGLKKVDSKYALVLNPDTVLEKNTITNFFETIKQVEDFWLIGPSSNQIISNFPTEKNILEVKNLKGFAIFLNLHKFKNTFFDENFFLYFEEIDLCRNVIQKGGKIYIAKNLIIRHEGASSVKKDKTIEIEKNRNWHWMWSTFYYQKKYRGYFLAFLIIFPKLFSAILKTIYYQLIFNKDKRDIYFCRMSGIYNSMLGKKSWYRPSLD